jgi:hypothetical protein
LPWILSANRTRISAAWRFILNTSFLLVWSTSSSSLCVARSYATKNRKKDRFCRTIVLLAIFLWLLLLPSFFAQLSFNSHKHEQHSKQDEA